MKSTITKRIILLLSIALFISSLLVAFLGVFLSEGLIADIRGEKLVPDMSILAQCTIQFQEGKISQATYEAILENAANNHSRKYIVYNQDKTVAFTTEGVLNTSKETEIFAALDEVLKGKAYYQTFQRPISEPIVLVGVPIINGNSIVGAAFFMEDMLDLLTLRKQFFESLIVSIAIVIPFVAGLSYLVLKRIVKPIKNVASVALSLIEGDFSIRADETLKGEIGLLGKTINELSVELYRNISQLYIEKNRLQQVLNSLDEGMIAVDESKKITHYNKAFLTMFSLDEDRIKGAYIENFAGLNEELRELSQAIEGKYPIIKSILYQEIILRTVIAPIENGKAEVVGAVILFRDITEIEKLETMRRDYVANVSHELRSPLTSIRGLIEPLKDSVVTDEEDKKRYYDIIYQESLRLSRLIDDIMELSRLQTNDAEIEKNYIDINPLLEMVYERYKRLDEAIDLQYEVKSLPKVFSNYDRIEQILVILLDNAYKFTPKGGKIEIISKVTDEKVMITVKDTGQGISKEDLPYIFDRFYKSDKSRSRRGTGLGLSIAKEILNIMGESIEVQSEVGNGSAFTFTIHLKTK